MADVKCPECGVMLKSQQGLANHLAKHHTGSSTIASANPRPLPPAKPVRY